MSVLPPKADICSARGHVRFGPITDSCTAAIYFYPQHLIADPQGDGSFSRCVGLVQVSDADGIDVHRECAESQAVRE
jgi:hypothetical protein